MPPIPRPRPSTSISFDLDPKKWTTLVTIWPCLQSGVRRGTPCELRRHTCERMLAGEAVKDLVAELAISEHTLYRWRRRAPLARRVAPGAKSYEEADPLQAARRRIELEAELELVKAASALFEEGGATQKQVPGCPRAEKTTSAAPPASTYYGVEFHQPSDAEVRHAAGRRHRRHPRPLPGSARCSATRAASKIEQGLIVNKKLGAEGPCASWASEACPAKDGEEPKERPPFVGTSSGASSLLQSPTSFGSPTSPTRRGQALLLRGARLVLPQSRRLGHRPAL